MDYKFTADLLVLLHLAFILFVVFGAAFLFFWPKLAWAHLPAIFWGALIEFSGGVCPLTPLENHFRRLAGEAGYSGGFIEEYLLRIIYPPELQHELHWLMGAAVILVNLVLYLLIIFNRKRGS